MNESEFIDLYAQVVQRAKEFLAEANGRREDKNDWPAGEGWGIMGPSSRGYFIYKACDSMKINVYTFLRTLKKWPYSEVGWEQVEELCRR